jgi:hypothetical protein
MQYAMLGAAAGAGFVGGQAPSGGASCVGGGKPLRAEQAAWEGASPFGRSKLRGRGQAPSGGASCVGGGKPLRAEQAAWEGASPSRT